jgi:hypothetical protein
MTYFLSNPKIFKLEQLPKQLPDTPSGINIFNLFLELLTQK